MANLARFSKPSDGWTANDLLAYNISVSSQSPDDFYGQPLPTVASLSSIDPNLLSGTLGTQGLSDETYRLLQYLDLAHSGQGLAAHDFAREILRALGYEKRDLLLRTRYAIPLLISDDLYRSSLADVCLVQGSSIILMIVQEDRASFTVSDPEPQIIAGAVSTFQCNNRIRARLGEPELDSMTIPCIVMVGTRPIFYLVPITRELSGAIAAAQYPPSPTVVKKCVVAFNTRRPYEGMETPAFRQVALQHFTAFRTLAEAHWSDFMTPMETGI